MELNEYQRQAQATAVYSKDRTEALTYTVLALCGEAGELANKLKKHLRARTEPNTEVLADELGDVLWYVSAVAQELGYDLDTVAYENLKKLAERKAKNEVASHA